MLHASSPRTSREMVKKKIAFERTIVHPTRGRSNDAAHVGNDLLQIVVRPFRVNHDTIVPSALAEVCFLKRTCLHWRINEFIVVRRLKCLAGARHGSSELPPGRHVHEGQSRI